MRRTLTLLLALLAIVGLVACGDDDEGGAEEASEESAEDDGALTKAEFIERGDAICAELAVASSQVEPPAGPELYGDYMRELLPLAQQAHDDFAALVPPADGEDVHAALLEALESSISTVESAADAADGDTVTAEDLMAQANEEGSAADAQATEYGFVECGKSDEDEAAAGDETDPDARAEAYARQLVGEDTVITGCLDTEPAEQGSNGGCQFVAAYEGCHDGVTGGRINELSVEEQFPEAPELHEMYAQAHEACSA